MAQENSHERMLPIFRIKWLIFSQQPKEALQLMMTERYMLGSVTKIYHE